MNRKVFTEQLRGIYAAHGKTFSDGVAVTSIFRRVEELPDEFMTWAVGVFGDYERLPSNLGREMRRVLWPDYLEAHPKLRDSSQREACKHCTPDTPGWIMGWKCQGQRMVFRCCCNSDPRFAHLSAWTRPQVESHGYALEEPGMDYWREQVAAWRRGDVYHKPAGCAGVIGAKQDHVRQDHARELEWQEAGNW